MAHKPTSDGAPHGQIATRRRSDMQHLVRTIVSALVDYPEAVEVQQVDGETTCILEVRVSPEDIGKVIGRQGRNIAALRTLLHAVGAKERKHVLLEVLEDRPTTMRH
jgi:predicted RNA-binding protein YlqC (UPF0109 family)